MKRTVLALAVAAATIVSAVAIASSHREAPLITKSPKIDNTDFYMFRSYETGRDGFVTFIANFQPFQDPYGGPNYFMMDDANTNYEINVDNNGDAVADITFMFDFSNITRNLTVPVNGQNVPVPLVNIGPFGSAEITSTQNVYELYQVAVKNGALPRTFANNIRDGSQGFIKPSDNIGNKSIPNYLAYSDRFIYRIGIPGCATEGRVFVGQRREGFAVNLGEVFDLINTNPVGPMNAEPNDLFDKNVTSIALEVPTSCLTNLAAPHPVIGAWTTTRQANPTGPDQRSRLGMPLVNELVIGLPDKDKFNSSLPQDDGQFAQYVTNPVLPELVEILFPGVTAPNRFPRADLIEVYLNGLDGLNRPANVRAAEMLRLNTSIAPKAAAAQSNLGVLGNDLAGFPNGRRPGDDVVDITLRVAMGALLNNTEAPSGQLAYTDGTGIAATYFRQTFPYLTTPLPGSPNTGPANTGPFTPQ